MDITLEQIEGSIRTYKKALEQNKLTKEEKIFSKKKIEELKKLKEEIKASRT